MVPFKSCFMYDPQILNFYIANLESGPFFEHFDRPVEPGGVRRINKFNKTKCS